MARNLVNRGVTSDEKTERGDGPACTFRTKNHEARNCAGKFHRQAAWIARKEGKQEVGLRLYILGVGFQRLVVRGRARGTTLTSWDRFSDGGAGQSGD